MADVRVENLRKTFGTLNAVDDVNFSFPESSVTCLLGPSGCGKTTLMRIIAGLETPTAGDVYFGERRVTALPPRDRQIGMVFQYPVVYKGITVRQNIELPLKSEKLAPAERTRRVNDVIEMLTLGPVADKDVSRLDNGTRQKVSVAREVARQPRIILFDEPITNVDATAKLQLKRAFKEVTRRLSQTIVYVTHDQTEAMTLADQIALMRDGRIVQCDAPRELYNHPADRFGGWFLGNPGLNFFDAELAGDGRFLTLVSPLFPSPVAVEGEGLAPGAVTLGIRPEQILASHARFDGAVAAELLRKSIQIGGQYLLAVQVGQQAAPFKAKVSHDAGAALPDSGRIWLRLPLDRVTLFGPDGGRLAARFPAGGAAAA
ncbi:MAG: ABC transporter ATP-binding protein [Chloroflexota bacterium]